MLVALKIARIVPVVETEAVIYIASYVAHKFRHKFPDLDVPTKTLPLTGNWLSCFLEKTVYILLKICKQLLVV